MCWSFISMYFLFFIFLNFILKIKCMQKLTYLLYMYEKMQGNELCVLSDIKLENIDTDIFVMLAVCY